MSSAPYATLADLVARYGQIEIIRLSVLDGGDLTEINQDAVTRALNESSAVIDSYLRRRYLVPVSAVLPELNRACCVMTRYDLSFGEQKEPSEQVRLQRKEVIGWLEAVRDGSIVLSDAVPAGDQSFAMVSDRGFNTFADDGDPTAANVNSPPGADVPPSAAAFWSY